MSADVIEDAIVRLGSKCQVLVAIDWDDKALTIWPLVHRIQAAGGDEALIFVSEAEAGPQGRLLHRLTFDAGLIRNSDVHSMGYQSGFMVHIEQASEVHQLGDRSVAELLIRRGRVVVAWSNARRRGDSQAEAKWGSRIKAFDQALNQARERELEAEAAEAGPCLAGTPGCSTDHRSDADAGCATW